MYGRFLCVLKTNHVTVPMKICTYMCTSLNWVKGALSGLIEKIVQCTSDLQVFLIEAQDPAWGPEIKDKSVEAFTLKWKVGH